MRSFFKWLFCSHDFSDQRFFGGKESGYYCKKCGRFIYRKSNRIEDGAGDDKA